MGEYTEDLRDLGYEPTERESPFDEGGQLWTNSFELVCDETALVIRKDNNDTSPEQTNGSAEKVYKYRNSEKVKLYGGYPSSYDWGHDDDGRFDYDVNSSQ